jgi:hypothetical protein
MLEKQQKEQILIKAQEWFRDVLAQNHIKNTQKLIDPNEFKINPFLVTYLANFLTGNASPESIARALIYPRVLGTSITTSFGENMQKTFISNALSAFGSTTSGIDIEFVDQIDGRKKYCQLKAGPTTINKGDVKSVAEEFNSIRNLAKTNNLPIGISDLIVGVLYGEPKDLSANYKNIEKKHHYPVIVGKDFWHRLTGDENFYFELINAFGKVANEADSTKLLEDTVKELAQSEKIKELSAETSKF